MNFIFNKKLSENKQNEILSKNFPDRKIITIGKDVVKFEKIYINVLGKEYISQEKFENIIKK